MTTEVEEQLGGIRVVKAFGNEELASSKVESAISNIYDTSLEYLNLRTRFVPLFELIPMVITLLVLLLGGYLSINELITLGDFIALSTISVMVMVPEVSPASIVIDSLAKVKSFPEPVAVPVTE